MIAAPSDGPTVADHCDGSDFVRTVYSASDPAIMSEDLRIGKFPTIGADAQDGVFCPYPFHEFGQSLPRMVRNLDQIGLKAVPVPANQFRLPDFLDIRGQQNLDVPMPYPHHHGVFVGFARKVPGMKDLEPNVASETYPFRRLDQTNRMGSEFRQNGFHIGMDCFRQMRQQDLPGCALLEEAIQDRKEPPRMVLVEMGYDQAIQAIDPQPMDERTDVISLIGAAAIHQGAFSVRKPEQQAVPVAHTQKIQLQRPVTGFGPVSQGALHEGIE
jgi:hypothetical protein